MSRVRVSAKRWIVEHSATNTNLVVHAAFATLLAAAPRHEGTLGQTKLGPIAKALHGKLKEPIPRRRSRRASQERQGRLPLHA